jgi:hypothetical protein
LSKPRLLIVVNVDWFFLSHRMPIAVAALQAGYDVHLACGLTDRSQELARAGLSVHALPLARSGTRVLQELRTFLALRRIIIQVQPDVLHLVTIKPVLFGGIIARLLHRVRVVAAIPGLGTAFMQKGLQARVLQRLLFAAYRIAFANPRLVAISRMQMMKGSWRKRRHCARRSACAFVDPASICRPSFPHRCLKRRWS